MARLAGKTGNVYVASMLIEDCEDAWNEQVIGDVTPSADTGDYKVGSASAKFVVADGFGTGIIGSEVVSKDLSDYETIMAWVKSSANLDADDWAIMLDDSANLASPLVDASIPALTADVWTFIKISADLSGCSAIISVGLYQNVDKGAMSFWIDQLAAAKKIAGIRSWSLDLHYDALDSTGFDSSGVKEFLPALSGWSGRFSGLKDGAPLTIGSVVGLELQESATATQQFRGVAIITDLTPEISHDALVGYSYTFQGVHALEIATA